MSHAAEIDAVAENDRLAEQFFSQPPQAWEVALDDWQPRPLSSAERGAMYATFGLLACGAAAAFALLLFSDALLISPAPLASTRERPVATLAATASATTTTTTTTTTPAAPETPAPLANATQVAIAPVAATTPVAIAAQPQRAPRAQRAATDAVVTQARRALNAGDAGRARELANRAIRLAPGRAAAYIVLAGALDALGDRHGMRSAFRSCVARAHDALASACKTLAR